RLGSRSLVRTREASSSSLSAALTLACWAGSSLKEKKNTAHQITPKAAKATNAHLQPNRAMPANASGGVAAPPQRVAAHMSDCAVTRSRAGNQALSMRVRLGKHPASPAPNRKRITQRDERLQAAPVSAGNADQASPIRSKTRRTPTRSPSRPAGSSNKA